MRKILFVVAGLAVVVLGGREVAMAQENGTVPQNAVWLPVVEGPLLEDLYPECPYQAILRFPIDGEEVSGFVVFLWDLIAGNENPEPPDTMALDLIVEFADDPDFHDIVYGDGDFYRKSLEIDLSPLAPGMYYWRVRIRCAVLDDPNYNLPLYGPWSSIETLVVAP